jgi:hypothetical protein
MKSILYTLGTLFVLFACSQDNQKRIERVQADMKKDTPTNPDIIFSSDSQEKVKQKLIRMAKLDNKEFGELTLFDEYYNGMITKYYIKDLNSDQRNMTLVLYDERLRYLKMLFQHVGDTTAENINKNFTKIKYAINKTIESGTYKIVDNNYLIGNQNGEVWYTTWLVIESKKTGTQDYIVLMSPETEFNYLKYMVNTFLNAEGLESKFLIY